MCLKNVFFVSKEKLFLRYRATDAPHILYCIIYYIQGHMIYQELERQPAQYMRGKNCENSDVKSTGGGFIFLITCSQLRKIPILTDTLLGTNIFHPFPFQDTFEDAVPFPKVGYVSFREGVVFKGLGTN